jgi:hypothetical protein
LKKAKRPSATTSKSRLQTPVEPVTEAIPIRPY